MNNFWDNLFDQDSSSRLIMWGSETHMFLNFCLLSRIIFVCLFVKVLFTYLIFFVNQFKTANNKIEFYLKNWSTRKRKKKLPFEK